MRRTSCSIMQVTVGDGVLRAKRHGMWGEVNRVERDRIASGLRATSHGH